MVERRHGNDSTHVHQKLRRTEGRAPPPFTTRWLVLASLKLSTKTSNHLLCILTADSAIEACDGLPIQDFEFTRRVARTSRLSEMSHRIIQRMAGTSSTSSPRITRTILSKNIQDASKGLYILLQNLLNFSRMKKLILSLSLITFIMKFCNLLWNL